MREERNKAESVPARSEERRPRRSRSREAFRQRQKELAESRGQEKRAQENGGQEKRVQEKRVQENKLQENRVQDTPGTGEDRTRGGQPGYDGQGTFNTQGKGPFDKFLSMKNRCPGSDSGRRCTGWSLCIQSPGLPEYIFPPYSY